MNIVLSGYPASGTTTLAKELADRHSLTRIDAGDIVREVAQERGQSMAAFDQTLCENEALDRELDAEIRTRVSKHERVVLESCYSGHRLENKSLHVWVTAPREQRIQRFADRENITHKEAEKRVPLIEDSIRFRAQEFYGIDIEDHEEYDAVIETGQPTVSESVEEIQDLLFDRNLLSVPI